MKSNLMPIIYYFLYTVSSIYLIISPWIQLNQLNTRLKTTCLKFKVNPEFCLKKI